MTLDEAIEFCKEKSRNIKLRTEPKTFEQIAEWLEELKQYRAIGTVEECKNSVLKILEAYNKAIDDFKEELFKNSERVRPVGWLGYSEIVTCEKIYDIAEKLKESEQHIQKDKRDFEVVEEFFTDSKKGDRK